VGCIVSKAVQNFLKTFQAHKAQNKEMGPEVISALLSAVQSIQSALTVVQLKDLTEKVSKIQKLLTIKSISEIKPAFGGSAIDIGKSLEKLRERRTNVSSLAHAELEKIAVNRPNPKTKEVEYLLHRATESMEYANSARPLINQPDQPTKVHTVNTPALKAKMAPNSEPSAHEARPTDFETKNDTAWVLDFVTAEKMRNGASPVIACWIPKASIMDISGDKNDGTWSEMGANPHAREFRVIVKPGKYEIYQELKS